MPGPTYVGASRAGLNSGYNTNQPFQVPLPSGTQVGDLLLIDGFTIGSSTGFSVVTYDCDATLNLGQESGNSTAWWRTGWKKVTATDVANGYIQAYTASQSYNGNNNNVVKIVTLRGANIAVNASAVSAGGSVIPTVTTTRTACALVYFGHIPSQSGNSFDVDYGNAPDGFTKADALVSPSRPYSIAAYRLQPSSPAGQQGGQANSTGSSNALIAVSSNNLPDGPGWAASGGTAEGATVDASQPIPLAWVPADPDGDPQVGYTIRYRPSGSLGAWTLIDRPTAGAAASGSIPGNTVAGKLDVAIATYDAVGRGAFGASRTITALPPVGAVSAAPTKLDPGMIQALVDSRRVLFPPV